MKRTKITLVFAVILFSSLMGWSQNIGLSSGERFEFKNGAEEWSEPITTNLFPKGSSESIPISIRIKFKKRVILACHYTVEVTNLSENKSLKTEVGTGYTDVSGKEFTAKFKLKPKAADEGKLMYAAGMKKPKSAQDCLDCSWSMGFYNVKIK